MKNTLEKYNIIVTRLKQLRSRQKLSNLLDGVIFISGLILTGIGISLCVEAVFHFNPTGRITINALLIVLTLGSGAYFLVYPVVKFLTRRSTPSIDEVALWVGKRFPEIKDHLSNAIQIYRDSQKNSEGYSVDLVKGTLLEINEQVAHLNFFEVVDYSKLQKSLKFSGIVLGVVLALGIIFSSQFASATQRLLHPTQSFEEQVHYDIQVKPGDIKINKGKNVELSATVKSTEYVEDANLIIENLVSGQKNEWYLHADANGNFKYLLENVTDSVNYAFKIKDQASPFFRISVVEIPLIRNIQIQLRHPAYTKIPPRFLDENVGDIVALKGTQATFAIKSNKPLQKAWIEFGNQQKTDLTVRQNEAAGVYNLKESTEYVVRIIDNEELANENPINYHIDVLEDHFPTVKINVPGSDVDVTGDMRLIIMSEAEDDFGFSSARLNYQVIREKQAQTDEWKFYNIQIANKSLEKIAFDYDWELSELGLNPSDWVQYNIEVFDNDVISGPKSTKSLTYTLRYPSLNEMYDEMNVQQDETDQNLDQLLNESKDLKEKINEIVEEMKKDPQVSWEEKKNIEEALDQQKNLVNKLEQTGQQIEELLERIEKNDLVTQETLEKYQELQQLFEEIATPEMQKAMEELQKALDSFDPQKLQQAMQKMEMNQESLQKSLERTISLLKRLQIEQKLDEIVKKAEALAQQQEELNKAAENATEDQGEQLADQQSEIQKDTEALNELMNELAEKMSELPDMPTDAVKDVQQQMQEQQLLEQMQQAAQNFRQSQMKSGAQKGQKSQQSLQNMADLLSQIKQQMQQQQMNEVMQAMRRSAREMLQFSKKQESLMEQSQQLNSASPQFNQLAEQQLDLMRAFSRSVEKLLKLSQKTFHVSPEIGAALGKSIQGMKQSVDALEKNQGANAGRNQGMAMDALNDVVQNIRNSMENMQNSGSGSGMQQFMQQLQQAAGKQQGLNQQTQQLGESGQLTMGQQAQLARLAAEQRQLQQMMEDLNKTIGDQSDILGRLDEVAKEMGDVADELTFQQRNINPQTIKRQQQILSRLLDAQKSMRTRDYSKKRESEGGKNYLPRRIAELPQNMGEQQIKMREDLLRALKEGYSRDYKELIKKYFDALSKGIQNEN